MTKKKKLGIDPMSDISLSWMNDSDTLSETGMVTSDQSESQPGVKEVEIQQKTQDRVVRANKERDSDLREGYKRHSFIVRKDLVRLLKLESVNTDVTIYQVLEQILEKHFTDNRG